MKRFKIIVIAFLVFAFLGTAGLYAQQKDRVLPKANQEYAENKFVEHPNYCCYMKNYWKTCKKLTQ